MGPRALPAPPMLDVLRHYLPVRKGVLVLSETLILSAVLCTGLTMHLWEPDSAMYVRLALLDLSLPAAVDRCLLSAFLLAAVSQIALSFNELYDFRISSSRYERASRFVESAGTALALSLALVVVAHLWNLNQVLSFPGLSLSQTVQTLTFTLLFGFGLSYVGRNFFHWVLRKLSLDERTLILGDGDTAHELAREMMERADSGHEVLGLVSSSCISPGPPNLSEREDDEPLRPRKRLALVGADTGFFDVAGSEVVPREIDTTLTAPLVLDELPEGSEDPLYELVRRKRVDLIVVALADRRRHLPTESLLRCRLDGCSVEEHSAVYEQITGKISVTSLRPSYLIFNRGFRRHPWAELAKRLVDIVLSLVILSVTWPFMIATAIAVRLDSPGPSLFSQERVGKNGVPFTLMKFRSMRADAEKATGPVWAQEDDPRITKVGKFIRKTRLDELPQLFNVLAGDMSLIGPRPERPPFVDSLSEKIPYYRQRHITKPGLTGWAQINYPYGNTVEDSLQKLQFDLFYIKNQSLLFDLSILFNTIKTVVLRQGT